MSDAIEKTFGIERRGGQKPDTGVDSSAGHDSLMGSHDGPDGSDGPVTQGTPTEQERMISRPNSAPAYYQGRPASLLITAMTPRRKRTTPDHPVQAVTNGRDERHRARQPRDRSRPAEPGRSVREVKAGAMSRAGSGRSTAEEEKVILATVQRLLDTMANRDKEGMSEILVPEGWAIQSRDHQISRTSLRDFPEKMPGGTERLDERFYNPLVRVDDDIAMVWAEYDLRVGGEVHHWGTNILIFLKQDGQWRVSAIADNGRSGPRPEE